MSEDRKINALELGYFAASLMVANLPDSGDPEAAEARACAEQAADDLGTLLLKARKHPHTCPWCAR